MTKILNFLVDDYPQDHAGPITLVGLTEPCRGHTLMVSNERYVIDSVETQSSTTWDIRLTEPLRYPTEKGYSAIMGGFCIGYALSKLGEGNISYTEPGGSIEIEDIVKEFVDKMRKICEASQAGAEVNVDGEEVEKLKTYTIMVYDKQQFEICAYNARDARVMAYLLAWKPITSGFDGEEFDQMLAHTLEVECTST